MSWMAGRTWYAFTSCAPILDWSSVGCHASSYTCSLGRMFRSGWRWQFTQKDMLSVFARHVIGSYLGRELDVIESDGSRHGYGRGLPISITETRTEEGQSHWSALPLVSRDLDPGSSHGGLEADDEAEQVAQSLWAAEAYQLKAPEEAEVEDPWRSATFCVEMEIDGQMQKACVSVAVLTLDEALAAELGVPLP